MNKSVRFSILTPVRNREDLLLRVGISLERQTYKNFEWLCGDDGSTDNTKQTAKKIYEENKISGEFVSFDRHVGKSVVDNNLLSKANGKYILWCDSDDFFHEKALEIINKTILEYEKNDISPIIIALSERIKFYNSKNNNNRNVKVDDSNNIKVLNCIDEVQGAKDGMMVVPKKLYEKVRFPEVDFYVPEYSIIRNFRNHLTIVIYKKLKYGDYLDDGITKGSGEIKYARGLWFESSLSLMESKKENNTGKVKKFINLINYFRLAYLAHTNIIISYEIIKKSKINLFYSAIAIAISYIINKRDVIQKKIQYTYKVFDVNIENFNSENTKYENENKKKEYKVSHALKNPTISPICWINECYISKITHNENNNIEHNIKYKCNECKFNKIYH